MIMNLKYGVMMKRKSKEQEVTTQNNFDKSTENKENTYNADNTSSDSELNGPIETSSQKGEFEELDSDKMVLEVKAAEEKLAEMQDRYVRLSAEFDNYRKRTLREKMDLSKYAGENLFLGIIPLMDDFERALKHMDTATDCIAMKDGIDIIYGKFSEFLKQNGVKEIEALNSNFNVDLHEAVAKVPVPEPERKGKVIDVVEKGYYLQDKILRFSKVVVGE
jgi:molecular chaperone GrpE